MFLLLACTSSSPIPGAPPVPVGPPAPTAETLAAATTLDSDVTAAVAAFSAAYAQQARLLAGDDPCGLEVAGPVVWAGTNVPEPPGVREAKELLHAVDATRYPAPPEVAVVGGPGEAPEPARGGTAPDDFARVRARLGGNTVVYVESLAEPPSTTTGRVLVWRGATRELACVAEAHGTFGLEPGGRDTMILDVARAQAKRVSGLGPEVAPVPPEAPATAAPAAAPPAAR